MKIHEIRTEIAPAEVIARARSFFALAGTPYAASPEQSGDGFLKLHMEVGEILIGASEGGGYTWVRATASRGEHLLTRFLTTLAAPARLEQSTHRYGVHETRPAAAGVLARPASTGLEPRRAVRAA